MKRAFLSATKWFGTPGGGRQAALSVDGLIHNPLGIVLTDSLFILIVPWLRRLWLANTLVLGVAVHAQMEGGQGVAGKCLARIRHAR